MTLIHIALRRVAAVLALSSLLAVAVAGCAGPTELAVDQRESPYAVNVAMDPHTLNPPQLATLNFEVTDRVTGKPVTAFTPLYGALLHNVLISKDLLHFQHGYTGRFAEGGLSVLTNFAVAGEYVDHALFQPEGGMPQDIRSEITTGSAEMRADLVPDIQIPKVSQGVRHDLVFGPNPLRAGQPAQLALYISEKGQPVLELDSLLGVPGLMFVSSQDGEHFAVEAGASPGRALPALSGGTPGATPSTPIPTRPATGSTPGTEQQGQGSSAAVGGAGGVSPAPTLMPEVAGGLATLTAQPAATLVPVQQTAMVSVMETPAVVPAVSYGPYVAFTHTFPEPGLYKLWFKTSYRQRTMIVDFVVQVGQ